MYSVIACVEIITLFRQFLDNFNKDNWEYALSGSNSPIHPFFINPFCGLNHLASGEAQLSGRCITIKVKGSLALACFLPSVSEVHVEGFTKVSESLVTYNTEVHKLVEGNMKLSLVVKITQA